MMEPGQQNSCTYGCQTLVPAELVLERLCVLHFIANIENTCGEMRRETVLDRTSTTRRLEMSDYIKTTAMKLSFVATGSVRLTDDIKKRVLTTFLTLMNLQESMDRSTNRFGRPRPSKSTAPFSEPVAIAG
jgi:hypothetical protein